MRRAYHARYEGKQYHEYDNESHCIVSANLINHRNEFFWIYNPVQNTEYHYLYC